MTESEFATYRWTVTRDHINTGEDALPNPATGWGGARVGWEGPRNCDSSLTTNPASWAAYDDDGELYYEGMLYGDYDGFEPLNDFAMPDAGAVRIKINGEWL